MTGGYVDLDAARWDLEVATGQAVAGSGVEARMREARAAAGRLATGLPGLLDELEQLRRTARPTLAELHACYLEVRQHTLSTANLDYLPKLRAQARYVRGEANELSDSVADYCDALLLARYESVPEAFTVDELAHVRHEIADVTLATVTLANIVGVTVEACIAEKTEHDRGRG